MSEGRVKVYVAGSRYQLPRVRAIMEKVKEFGTITQDWTQEVEKHQAITPTREQLAKYGLLDMMGVVNADLVIVCFNPREVGIRQMGTMVEWGIALRSNKPILVLFPEDCLDRRDIEHFVFYQCHKYCAIASDTDDLVPHVHALTQLHMRDLERSLSMSTMLNSEKTPIQIPQPSNNGQDSVSKVVGGNFT